MFGRLPEYRIQMFISTRVISICDVRISINKTSINNQNFHKLKGRALLRNDGTCNDDRVTDDVSHSNNINGYDSEAGRNDINH